MSEFVRRYQHPASWTPKKMGEVCTRITDRYSGGETVVLTASAERGLVDQREYFKRRVASKDLSTYYEIEKGDFAYNKSYSSGFPFGVIARLEEYPKGVVSPLYICFRASDPQANPDYLAHAFEAGVLDEQLQNITKEGSRNHGLLNVRVGDFFDAELFLPPKDQQRRIAEILSTVDEAIEHTEALIAKTEQIKTGLMHDLFTRGVTPDGRLRPPRDQAPELYKQSPLGWIPREWATTTLGELAEIVSGITLGPSEPDDGVVVPYLRVANVQDGYLDLSEVKTIKADRALVAKLLLKPGDILMNEGGDFDKLGRGTVWNGEIDPCIHQNHVFRVRLKSNAPSSRYIAYWSQSEFGKRYFVQSSKQSTNLASINSRQLKSFPVALPDPREDTQIESVLTDTDGRLETLQLLKQKHILAKQGLLRDLLAGKVAISKPTRARPADDADQVRNIRHLDPRRSDNVELCNPRIELGEDSE